MDSNNGTDVDMQPIIRAEQLTIGTVIVYHLLPEDNPTDPERAWRGRIIKTILCLDVVWVESLEEGFEGDTEFVLLTQIIDVEGEG